MIGEAICTCSLVSFGIGPLHLIPLPNLIALTEDPAMPLTIVRSRQLLSTYYIGTRLCIENCMSQSNNFFTKFCGVGNVIYFYILGLCYE